MSTVPAISSIGEPARSTIRAVSSAEIESRLGNFFSANPHDAVAVYLYGSVARGTCGTDSDVDLGILYARDPPLTLEGMPFNLEAELETLLGRPVQIAILNRAPPDFLHRVLRDGRIVLDRDRAARIRFEVRARMEFFDLEPYLKMYRQKSLNRDDRSRPGPEKTSSHSTVR